MRVRKYELLSVSGAGVTFESDESTAWKHSNPADQWLLNIPFEGWRALGMPDSLVVTVQLPEEV